MSRDANAEEVNVPCRFALAQQLNGPERLVGLGFRYWLAGYQTGDIGCWEDAWSTYSAALGPGPAKVALTDLSCWVRIITHRAQRGLEISPARCTDFCRDECIAISMIAACQHRACPASRACAFSLLGCSQIDDVVEGAECFASTMRKVDQVLSPATACGAAALILQSIAPQMQ